MRRAAKRDTAEPQIVDMFRALGCSVERMDRPCDLLVGFKGVSHLVEVKTGTKGYGAVLNGNQQDFVRTWRGGPVLIARTPEDAQALVNDWRAQALFFADRSGE